MGERPGVGLLALVLAGLPASASYARDLANETAIESRRQQTTLRIQRSLRESRQGTPSATAHDARIRAQRERMALEQMQASQHRQAQAVDQIEAGAARSSAGARSSYTIRRFEREQRAALDRARQASPSGAGAGAGSTVSPALGTRPLALPLEGEGITPRAR